MKNKTYEIDGVTFEVVRQGTKTANGIINTANNWCYEWDEVYSRPSRTKEEIKEYWEKSISEWGGYILGYIGNTFTFTIYAIISVFNEEKYIQITANHNRIVM